MNFWKPHFCANSKSKTDRQTDIHFAHLHCPPSSISSTFNFVFAVSLLFYSPHLLLSFNQHLYQYSRSWVSSSLTAKKHKMGRNSYIAPNCELLHVNFLFKASALWDDAFYKSKCPSVRLSVCSLLRYRLNVFLPPLPEVKCPIFLEIRNPWGKVMERSGLRYEHFCLKNV